MREVHRFVADAIFAAENFSHVLQRIQARKLEPTGRKVAIAGAGPAGLTCAFYLAMLGHDVTVFDEKPEAGGMLRFALPEYRLPKSVLRREIEVIEKLGVKFVFNTRIGFDLPLNELDDRFDAVFLSIGTWKESWIYQPGTELKGVYPALNFLEAVAKGETVPLGRKVAIIGGGNAAIDSARTAVRRDTAVTVFYRRERKDMPAIVEETRAAEEEGVKFVFMAAPHRLIGDSKGSVKAIEIVKTTLGEYDTSGRRKPVLTDQISRVECDSVIYAIGETVDLDFCRASGLTLKENGTIEVDRYALTTSRPRFYAGGDLVTGASNVSNAMAYGKQAARHVDQQLMEQDRWSLILPEFVYGQVAPDNPSASRRHEGHHIPANARARSCQEVVAGLSAEEVLDETCRCLRCDIKVADAS